ncbi:MAG TPA: cupin domain-containing protein [Methanocella sp.]|uniref:cupin domain-containing protein n=1 Tax=Methanocella sp. TaxID=2052833 RepID=UPI002C5D315D|nr:cupin domain-containing protein [Methanocella sp.]HTY92053.1 cupin domain-containing protein [Methanocella sp.]
MIRRRSNISSYVTKDGSRIWELFHPESSPVKDVSTAEALVEAGQETETHVHRKSQEIYYILEGSGDMRLGSKTMAVVSGDVVLIPPGMRHSIKNTDTKILRILCICSPPYSHVDTELDLPEGSTGAP